MTTNHLERVQVTAPEHFVRKALEMLENEQTPLNQYNVIYITNLLLEAIDELQEHSQNPRKIATDICPYSQRLTESEDE